MNPYTLQLSEGNFMTTTVLNKSDTDRAEHEAAYTAWLQQKYADSLADPRPRVSHEEAMARLDEVITRARTRRR